MKILIVEDEFILAASLEHQLNKRGFVVMGIADNSDDALEICKKEKPDLALLDIAILGDLDGIETAKVLQEMFQLPVIYCSGNSDKLTYDRAMRTKPIGFIQKPIDIEILSQMILSLKP